MYQTFQKKQNRLNTSRVSKGIKKIDVFIFNRLALSPPMYCSSHACPGVWLLCATRQTRVSVFQINRQADGREVSQRFTQKCQSKFRHISRQRGLVWQLKLEERGKKDSCEKAFRCRRQSEEEAVQKGGKQKSEMDCVWRGKWGFCFMNSPLQLNKICSCCT